MERSRFLTTLIFTQSSDSQQPVKLAFSKQLAMRMSEKFTSFTVAGREFYNGEDVRAAEWGII